MYKIIFTAVLLLGTLGFYVPSSEAAVTCQTFTHHFSFGATDDVTSGEVTALQTYLQRLGFDQLVSGEFGPMTAKNLFDWQKQQKLVSDNDSFIPTKVYFGPATKRLLQEQCTPTKDSVISLLQQVAELSQQLVSIQTITPNLTVPTTTESLYTNLYECALRRAPTTNELSAHLKLGKISQEKLYASILRSSEYKNKKHTNDEYITDAYMCIVGRSVTAAEKATLLAGMKARVMTRATVITQILESNEFTTGRGSLIASRFGFVLPRIGTEPNIQDNEARENFYANLYNCAFGRKPDTVGLNAWMATNPATTSLEKIYLSFLNGAEYQNKKTDNSAFIKTVYQCILNRKPDQTGLKSWQEMLDADLTRAGLVTLFVNSKEFQSGRGKTLQEELGYSLTSSYQTADSWVRWQGVRDPFAAGIPVVVKHTNAASTSCNMGAFTTTQKLKDFWIARAPSNGCNTPWQLIGFDASWTDKALTLTQAKTVFDPSKGVEIGDGSIITNAYDPSTVDINNETWISFECVGKNIGVNACMGPLKADYTLDTKRTFIIISGETSSDAVDYLHSASVPNLLSYKNKLYLYWVDVRRKKNVRWENNYTDSGNYLVTRGIEIKYNATDKRFYPVDSLGAFITGKFYAGDPRSVIVFDRDLSDPQSDRVADMAAVITDGNRIYFSGNRGGGNCLTPLSPSVGCYRPTYGYTTDPLTYRTFNQNFVADDLVPDTYQSYQRFFYRADNKTTWLVGGNFVVQNEYYQNNKLPIPVAKPAGSWAFPWPVQLFPTR